MSRTVDPSSTFREGFAHRVLRHRCRMGWTQAQLAERVGVSRSAVTTYETMTAEPTLLVLVRLAQAFGVTTDHLLGTADELRRPIVSSVESHTPRLSL